MSNLKKIFPEGYELLWEISIGERPWGGSTEVGQQFETLKLIEHFYNPDTFGGWGHISSAPRPKEIIY